MAVPIPIRLFSASIDKVPESKLRALTTLARVQVDAAPEVKFRAAEEVMVPEVAVRLSVPVVWVKPFEAVSSPAEVMAPVPVVVMLVEVVLPRAVTKARVSASLVKNPVMAVLVTPVMRPWASVVNTGTWVEDP